MTSKSPQTKSTTGQAGLKDISFKVFFAIWANQMSWEIPALHIQIIEFLEDSDNWDNKTGVLQVFRGAAKSTIVGLYIVWKLVRDPTYRFLIVSADHKTAVKITYDAHSIIERHPLAKHLKSDKNIWQSDRFWVTGSTDARTPSLSAYGVMSNVTGIRSDEVIFDDVEVPKNCAGESERYKMRNRISDTVHILVPNGKRLFVGTPHTFESIYPEQIENGASSLTIPLLSNTKGDFPNLTGDSSWPDRFTDEVVANRQQNALTTGEFLSQYLLIPYRSDGTTFDPQLLIRYRQTHSIYTANSETVFMIGDKRMVSCSAWWDPALSKDSGDDSVVCVVYTTADGHYYLHAIQRVAGDADAQCQAVKGFLETYHVPHLCIETNGIGNFLPDILRKYLGGTGSSVEGKFTRINKTQKIISAFEVLLASGRLHIHESVLDSKFLMQLRDFDPKTAGGRKKDDYIDTVAAAILNEPNRITAGLAYSPNKDALVWSTVQGEVVMELEPVSF